jgi:raffinose/stachyose/melibiose transport system substrate-binding protein
MMQLSGFTRRGLLAGGAGLAAAALVGCGTSTNPGTAATGAASGAPAGAATAGKATMWGLSGKPNEQILTDSVTAFNKLGKGTVDVSFFQNDAYKQKIRTAVGAGEAPTLIYGWGGGILKGYADAGQVADLTDWVKGQAAWKAKFFDSPWGAGTIGGKIFAVPTNNTQPIVMYYNKKLFDQVGASLPNTWDDVLKLVEVFNGKGIAPFSLGGGSKWTSMMWLEYMFDRIGGPEVFNNIYAGKKGSWGDESAIKAYKMIQDLVDANGFIKGFMSVTADSNADQALLYTGKAAMMLHGGWAYGGMKSAQPAFVKDSLAFGKFPSIAGGKGDPKNIVGNPANYWSISAKASAAEQAAAKNWLLEGMATDTVVDAFINSGGVPVFKAAEAKIASSADSAFLGFVFNLATSAPNFQQSWDQALGATQAEALLNNISQLFSKQIGPDQFATNMNATL